MTTNFPQLDNMTTLDLVILRKQVADSKDPTDIEFKKEIDDRLNRIYSKQIAERG